VATMLEEEDVELKVARLESDVAHICSDIAEMKIDIRELRHDVASLREEMRKGDASLREALTRSALSHKVWMLLSNGAMLAVMARGFKWL
jgi:predicted RNase H-like nuclease (RuvC/YqgF family)